MTGLDLAQLEQELHTVQRMVSRHEGDIAMLHSALRLATQSRRDGLLAAAEVVERHRNDSKPDVNAAIDAIVEQLRREVR